MRVGRGNEIRYLLDCCASSENGLGNTQRKEALRKDLRVSRAEGQQPRPPEGHSRVLHQHIKCQLNGSRVPGLRSLFNVLKNAISNSEFFILIATRAPALAYVIDVQGIAIAETKTLGEVSECIALIDVRLDVITLDELINRCDPTGQRVRIVRC